MNTSQSNTMESNQFPNRRRNYGAISGESSEAGKSNDQHDDAVYPQSPTPEQMKSTLSFIEKFGFGLGHVYNDLCAGVWFSYTLLFMQAVLLIPAPEAGALVMLGQVCDAISTPIVGLLADRFGTKKTWHVFGTILVFLTFPMIFSLCPWCKTAPHWWTPVYFAIFIIGFQFAWAVVQITHLSMIPEVSMTKKDRADLTATRYSASVCSNVIVYIITWVVLQGHSKYNNIGPEDAYRFRNIALILTLVGVTTSMLFHLSLVFTGYDHRRSLTLTSHQAVINRDNDGIEEGTTSDEREAETESFIKHPTDDELPEIKIRRKKNFLKSPLLYQNALLYVFSRLFMTTSLVYMPLWLDENTWSSKTSPTPHPNVNIGMDKEDIGVGHLATVPLVSFLASFASTMILKHLNRWIGHQIAYLIGSVISLIGCIWIAISASAVTSSVLLFSIAILFGAGSSITMISSLCITADMIGRHTYQGGFIYSSVTFADKLITGVVVVVIEILKCKKREDCPEYYRNVLAYGCGIATVLGILTLMSLKCIIKKRSRRIIC